jgi:integrase
MLGLRWKDIDFDRHELRIVGQMQSGERTKTKSKRSRRTHPLTADLVRVLRGHRQTQRQEQAISAAGWNASDLCSAARTARLSARAT